MDARTLFGRYLDLTPLGARSHGLVRCRFHGPERHPSLSVDLDRGLFHCFTCGAQGGVKTFRRLVNLSPEQDPSPLRRHDHRAQIIRELTDTAEEAGRCAERRAIRHEIAAARAQATTLGPDHPETWELLALAADLERHALNDLDLNDLA